MVKLTFLNQVVLPLLPFAIVANAAIGPSGTLRLTNPVLAPDGFNRTVVAANGKVPGPLIKGNKVCVCPHVKPNSAYTCRRVTPSKST